MNLPVKIIDRVKCFSMRLQQAEREHCILNRLNCIRRKDPYFMFVDPKELPSIKIEYGILNEEGQRVLANVLAEYLRKKNVEDRGISFGLYLEKAKGIVQNLSLEELVKLGLLSGVTQKSCFIPENYYTADPIIPD